MRRGLPLLLATLAFAQTLSVSPSQLRFLAAPNGIPTAPQTIAIQSASPVQVVAQADGWLNVSAEQNRLVLVADPANLKAGVYEGKVTVAAENESPRDVAVTFVVTSEPQLVLTLAEVNLLLNSGQVTGEREISVSSNTADSLPFKTRVRMTGRENWLTLERSEWTTPAAVVPQIRGDRLRPGIYHAAIVIIPSTGAPINVPVTLQVDNLPEMKPEPGALEFQHYLGDQPPAPQTVQVASSGAGFPFTLTASGYSRDTIWLAANPLAGTTPASLRISINPTGLGAGTYRGNIRIQGEARNSPLDLPVTLIVHGDALLQVQPTSLSFSIQPGGQGPGMQSIEVVSRQSNIGFSAYPQTAAGGDWLAVSAPQAQTPGRVIVSLKDAARSLAPGRYPGTVLIMTGASRAQRRVPVILNVRNSPVAVAKPAFVEFAFQQGSLQPAMRQVTIEGPAGTVYRAVSNRPWLQLSSPQVAAGQSLTLSVDPQMIGSGRHSATVTLDSPEAPDAPVTIAVTADVRGTSVIRANPPSLIFTYPSPSSAVQTQILNVTSSGDPVNYDLAFSAQPFGRWLRLGTVTGITPGSVRVEVDPTGLRGGTYTGTIAVSVRGGNNQIVPVTLTIGSGN